MGNVVLGVYLVLIGFIALASISVSPVAMGVLALVAGILVLVGR